MNEPLVSVIIPCYNVSAYVKKAIGSILDQSYSRLEIWIIDDASNDDTLAKINEFKDETTSTFGLKYFAEEHKTKSQYLYAIKNFEGRFIAILGVDYTGKKHKLTHEQDEELLRVATSLGGVLSSHLKI